MIFPRFIAHTFFSFSLINGGLGVQIFGLRVLYGVFGAEISSWWGLEPVVWDHLVCWGWGSQYKHRRITLVNNFLWGDNNENFLSPYYDNNIQITLTQVLWRQVSYRRSIRQVWAAHKRSSSSCLPVRVSQTSSETQTDNSSGLTVCPGLRVDP